MSERQPTDDSKTTKETDHETVPLSEPVQLSTKEELLQFCQTLERNRSVIIDPEALLEKTKTGKVFCFGIKEGSEAIVATGELILEPDGEAYSFILQLMKTNAASVSMQQ